MIGDQEELIEIPDFPEHLVGWRCWRVGGDGTTPLLRSPWVTAIWPTRDRNRDYMTAICALAADDWDNGLPHVPPSPSKGRHGGMGCGIYAYRDIPALAWDFPMTGLPCLNPKPSMQVGPTMPLMVWGQVGIWGNVYPHEHGWRAQFARVESIAYVEGACHITLDMAQWLADSYGVPVVTLKVEDLIPEIQKAHESRRTHKRLLDLDTWGMTVKMGKEAIETVLDIGRYMWKGLTGDGTDRQA